MGVDIQTYRGRIGCFSRNFDTDVLTVQYIVNFTRGIKTIGTVVFIGILLLLAGIEQNPGPISGDKKKEKPRMSVQNVKSVLESTSRRTPANATTLKVCGLPKDIGKDSLINIFENTRRQGGGNVLRVDFDENNSSALVTFEEAEALQLVLRKRPIHIDGKDVSVEIFYGDYPMNENICSQIDEAGEVCADKPNDLQLGSDSENVNTSGAVAKLASNLTRTVTERVRKGFGFIKSAAKFVGQDGISLEFDVDESFESHPVKTDIKRSDSSNTKESVAADIADSKPDGCGLKRPNSSRASTEAEGQIFYQILQRLGLTDKYPGKISMQDVIAFDPNESVERVNEKISLTDIPWLVLKRLICVHSESRDITVSTEESSKNSFNLEDTLLFFPEKIEVNQNISPLDTFTVVFQCCDPVMKQIFVQKLYLCKLAIPFLYRHWGAHEKQNPVLSIWPLRSLVIESKQRTANKKLVQGKESYVLDLPTQVLAFGRLGRPRYSKSKLINGLLLSQGCKTFFNIDCVSGMTQRQVSNGQVEMFWLPTIDVKKDRFQNTLTFFNLRGDLDKDFGKDLLLFISNVIDSIVIIVDSHTVLKHSNMVKDVLLKFPSVILIIADPLNNDVVKLVQSFQSDEISSKSKLNLQLLSTHQGAVEMNVVDMLSSITKQISNTLKKGDEISLEERLSRATLTTIKTDEEEEVCQHGKLEATRLIKQMKAEGDPSGWKQHLTPVHGIFSKQLGKLIKDRERQKDFQKGVNIDKIIKSVRQQQIASITKTVRFFLDIFLKINSSPLVLKHFLCWLHFLIEREKQQIIPHLMQAKRSAWEKLKTLKSAKRLAETDIEKQEIVITDLEKKIDEASFSVQHFFREIGHIYEAILALKEDTTKLGLPNVQQTSSIIGRLVADGHQFELIDGESFFMPHLWIKAVMNKVDVLIGSSKVMTLGVLGLQSSGKSTLLNTMFGSQFASRTGRCTRGIHVQLIPTKTEQMDIYSSVFNYVLIVDTEGLRSPELSHLQHEHDNQLATVITGVGDVTIFNIMGENTSEIRDILQVIVHAFLRLKITNEKLDIRKSCAFVHQNVTDTSAPENMISGLNKLMQMLDEMTKESAKTEGIHDIKTFNQVIEFDTNSQVWYLKNLWQGNPPMARVNYEYSEGVVDIKCKILKKALTMKNKSYKTVCDIAEQAHDLWKGVLAEDFVFSFRNSLEIKVYLQLERVVKDELCSVEYFIQDKITQISQSRFAACDQKENLHNVAGKIISDLGCILSDVRTKTLENIKRYFDGNKYKDITIQWERSKQICVIDFFDNLQKRIKADVEKFQEKRSIQIFSVSCYEKHEEKLRKKSIEVASAHKGQNLNDQMIDKLFEDIWKDCMVDFSYSSSEKYRIEMRNIFKTCLENIFRQNNPLLMQVLKDTDFLAPLPEAKLLAKMFCEKKINDTDLCYTIYQKGKSNMTKYVEDRVNQIFKSVDGKIKELCQVNDEITEMSVNKLMHELDSILQCVLTDDNKCTFKTIFYVKLYVHVSRYAHPIFDTHNEKYFKTHDTAILLEQCRSQHKISFMYYLRCRKIEESIAELLINVIESFAKEWTSQNLPNKVAHKLQSFLPKVKNEVIIQLCTDLLEKSNFENFDRYIVDPYGYARSWITKEANYYLDDSKFQVIAETSELLLDQLFTMVKTCVREIHKEYERKPSLSIVTWIESFQKTVSTNVRIPSENFRNVRLVISSRIQDVGHLTNILLEYLGKSEKKLASMFKSQKSYSIKWAGFNPVSRLIEKIWGCQGQCAYCGEPCAKDQNHVGSKHYCIQHRPSCCSGTYQIATNLACLESCHFKVQSNITHRCSVFNYACNNGKQGNCGKTHYYKDFKTYLPNWDIAPSSNMHDSSEYWMWFVATYKEQLKEKHGYLIDHIPSSWSTITKSAAKESLQKVYLAC